MSKILIHEATAEKVLNPQDDAFTTLAFLLAIPVITEPLSNVKREGFEGMVRVSTVQPRENDTLRKTAAEWIYNQSGMRHDAQKKPEILTFTQYEELMKDVKAALVPADGQTVDQQLENLKSVWKKAFLGPLQIRGKKVVHARATEWENAISNRLRDHFSFKGGVNYYKALNNDQFKELADRVLDPTSFLLVAWFFGEVLK